MPLVLIVEDDVNINQMLQEIFSLEGFGVEAAFDGEEALAKVRAKLPSAILLDIGLPKKTGWEVIEVLKGDPKTRGIPVVLHSALNQQEDIERGLLLGAAKYLTKPCDPLVVVATIKEVVGP